MRLKYATHQQAADLVFHNGSVLTVDARDSEAQSLAVLGTRISYVGTSAGALALAGPGTRIIDLDGRTLVPGFIDSHYHPILNGLFGDGPDAPIIRTAPDRCPSIEDILSLVREAAALRPAGSWISMMGYDQNKLAEGRHPTREELDDAAPDHPVQCIRACGHIAIYNSLALAAIGVDSPADAANFPEGEIEVKGGRLTGLVYDHTHFLIWSKVGYSEAQQFDAAMTSNRLLLENGITSVHDAGEFGPLSYQLMENLCRRRMFKPRSCMMIHSVFGKPFSLEENRAFVESGRKSWDGDEYFRFGACKFMIDGGTSGPSCATRQPYSHDPDLPGILGWTREETAAYIDWIHQSGCQATAHAVGDLAVEFMVEGYEKAMAANPRPDPRHRIEHCAIVDSDLIRRMADLGLCPSLNPGFLAWNGSNYVRYYGDRMKQFIALRDMVDAGIRVSLGSDAPSGPMESMALLDACVNRIDRSTGEVLDQTQAITLPEALRLYTVNGAIASGEEALKGSLEPGKLADLAVLSGNLLATPAADLRSLQVDMTVIDGIVEYERE